MSALAEIRVLVLEGRARERGRIHGETLRSEIRSMVGAWKQDIHDDLGMDPDLFLEEFIAETDFLPAIRRWTPDLLEEVEGIAEGAGVPFGTIFSRQLSDEEPWFRLEKKVAAARSETGRSGGECLWWSRVPHAGTLPIRPCPLDSRTEPCYTVRQRCPMQRTKLTIRVSRDLLEGAKQYASQHDTTLTRLVSEFLRRLDGQGELLAQAPAVQRLSGILPQDALEEDYRRHLEEKYGTQV